MIFIIPSLWYCEIGSAESDSIHALYLCVCVVWYDLSVKVKEAEEHEWKPEIPEDEG
jgi:hypothetical protein